MGFGSVESFASSVSRLVNDDEQGFAFVLDSGDERRLAALATLLELEPADLRSRLEVARCCPVLVLDPRLSVGTISAITVRQRKGPDAFRCVELTPVEGNILEALRDAARNSGPYAVVVVRDEADEKFFKFADLRVTTAQVNERRLPVLPLLPDLFPLLVGARQDDDGMPMMPDPAVERTFRERMRLRWSETSAEPLSQDIIRADKEGQEVTFRLDSLLEYWRFDPNTYGQERERERKRGYRASVPDATWLRDVALTNAFPPPSRRRPERREEYPTVFDAPPPEPRHEVRTSGPDARSFMWVHAGRVRALVVCVGDGPMPVRAPSDKSDDRGTKVGVFHPVHDVVSFGGIVAALRRVTKERNPYGTGGVFDMSVELQAFAEETGIELSFDPALIRAYVADHYPGGAFVEGVPARRSKDEDARVHKVIDDVLGRKTVLPVGWASILFELELVRRSPLVHVGGASESAGTIDVVANIGAGNILRVSIREYPAEKPGPLRLWKKEKGEVWEPPDNSRVLDAGNLRLTLESYFNGSLEGLGGAPRSVARRRKRAAEEASRRAADLDE